MAQKALSLVHIALRRSDTMTSATASHYQIAFMPYIGMSTGTEVRFANTRLLSVEKALADITDTAIQQRVRDILAMYQDAARRPGRARQVRGMGVIRIGSADLRPWTIREELQTRDFRIALFLCGLASNNRLSGPNSGHDFYTSENFDVIYQNFSMGSDFVSETSGLLVRMTNMGFKISETRFTKPPHVNLPLSFRIDEKLLRLLQWTRQRHRRLYSRIMRATAVYLESYYNATNVDIRARVLLQVSAFEILFDLPEKQPRKAFKDAIERLTNSKVERRFQFKIEVPGKMLTETRSVKGLWADRFYTLRNHIVHGESVPRSEYQFRGKQHHLVISPLFFVMAVRRMIDEARASDGLVIACSERLFWTVIDEGDEYDPEMIGFKAETDYYALFEQHEAEKDRRKRRQAGNLT